MKTRLYINGTEADFNGDGVVLFTYQVSDISSPASVKNSFSQSITLPPTPRNRRIFGNVDRLDTALLSETFNPQSRTPFEIYNARSEKVVSGYCRLNEVTKDGYKISLFGGLGGFIYSLTYDAQGRKKTLASLDFGSDLTFTINASTVLSAWGALGVPNAGKWGVINFAPALNGLPENFEAGKAIAKPADVGLPVSKTSGGKTYRTTAGGYCLISLSQKFNEWQAQDLRSYLQRPVIRLAEILKACGKPYSNGGYTLDLSLIENDPRLAQCWVTLPLLSALAPSKAVRTIQLASLSSAVTTGKTVGEQVISLAGAPVDISVKGWLTTPITGGGETAWNYTTIQTGQSSGYRAFSLAFVEVVAKDAGGNALASSKVVTIGNGSSKTNAALASEVNFTPATQAGFEGDKGRQGWQRTTSGDGYAFPVEINVKSLQGAYSVELRVTSYEIRDVIGGGLSYTGGTSCEMTLWNREQHGVALGRAGMQFVDNGSVASTIDNALRSGQVVTQDVLLSSTGTPADYLLAWCKMNGYYIVCDDTAKKVTIYPRGAFFKGDVVDLSGRADLKDASINPLVYSAKWLSFSPSVIDGASAKDYKSRTGNTFGGLRVDTGYLFDDSEKKNLDGIRLKAAVQVEDRGYFYKTITQGGKHIPSVFQQGGTFSLWDDGGNNLDTALPVPTSVGTWWNTKYNGYSGFPIAEFRDASDKAMDGADVLLIYQQKKTLPLALSDDLQTMYDLAGQPCWRFQNNPYMSVPVFGRFRGFFQNGKAFIQQSLDYSIPREFYFTDEAVIDDGATMYEDKFERFIADTNATTTKILSCRVIFKGLPAGVESLRSFYYIGGAVWALSKVANYDISGDKPAQCEFIKVNEIQNYL